MVFKYRVDMFSIKEDLPVSSWLFILRLEHEHSIDNIEISSTEDDVFISLDCFSDICEQMGLPSFKNGIQ